CTDWSRRGMLVKVAVRSGAVCKRKASLSSSALSDWESAECQGEEVRFSPRAFGTQRQIRTKLLHCFAFVGFGAASMRARFGAQREQLSHDSIAMGRCNTRWPTISARIK